MSTRGRVAPDLLGLVDSVSTATLTEENLPALRQAGRARLAQQPEPVVAPVCLAVPVHRNAPPLSVLHYRPPVQPARSAAVLHIHGGGMISGSPRLSRFASAAQALALDLPVFSVDYRLAPEAPFPAQLDDCYAVLAWLHAEADAFGIDPARIIVSGDSAGGGLAAGLALMVRDRGELSLAAQVLTYPMLDYRTGLGAEDQSDPATGEFCWTRQHNTFAWAAYRGPYDLADHRRGWFAPALAEDLAGLPPTWIGVGELDLFRAECARYAQRLAAAGVPVSFREYAGAPHAFNASPDAAVAQIYRADLRTAFAEMAGTERGGGGQSDRLSR